MNTRTILFDHMKTIIKMADRIEDGSLVRRMKAASGKPSSKKGPVLPDLHEMELLAGELPEGYPQDMAFALLQSCRHMLLNETVISAIHVRKKLSGLPEGIGKQAAMDALNEILSCANKTGVVPQAEILCGITKNLSETDLDGVDALDRAIIQNTPARMLDAVIAVHGRPENARAASRQRLQDHDANRMDGSELYFICYEHPEQGSIYETVSGEDAMQQRVYELTDGMDLDEDDIHVFDQADEL